METQAQQVLTALRSSRNGLTSMDAFHQFQITRLSARVFELRQIGYDISTVTETKKRKTYARYFLNDPQDPDDIKSDFKVAA